MSNIRNFAIISHIYHGKSTLADRMLEITGSLEERKREDRFLDSMELEKEKGITIKLKTVRMEYRGEKNTYILNLIDTPGHVDFSYEVSRALAACEGSLLLVDATQGVQAQTLSVLNKAKDLNLTIIPVINKIDSLDAKDNMQKVEIEMREVLGGYKGVVSGVSGKTGEGVKELLTRIIEDIPYPKISASDTTKALVFDSFYDSFKGVVALVRVFEGCLLQSDKLSLLGSKTEFEPIELGFLEPGKLRKVEKINNGEVGYIATGLKDIALVNVGDTLIAVPRKDTVGSGYEKVTPLPGYKKPQPMVFLSFFPKDSSDFLELKKALEKLKLTDAALDLEPIYFPALGSGFKVGFLGLLHAEIISERLRREYTLDIISTSPSVIYELLLRNGNTVKVSSAADFPDPSQIAEVREPKVKARIFTPAQFLGGVSTLIDNARGEFLDTRYLGEKALIIEAKFPLSELMTDFYDRLKSTSSGYASLDWEFVNFEKEDLVKLDILIHGEVVESLSRIVIRRSAYNIGKKLLEQLKEVLPREQFKVALQAAISGKILARETLQAYRKDVTAKLYGGDRTRRDKLLKKQAKGKKKMESIGRVSLSPQQLFKLL